MKTWVKQTFRHAAWAPLSVFVFYAIAAKVFNLYILYPHLDIPTHFCGGMAITYFFLAGIHHLQKSHGQFPRVIQPALALGMTAVTAVIWEFLEFASDWLFDTKMNLGVGDTLADLFFGLAGALVVIAMALLKPAEQA